MSAYLFASAPQPNMRWKEEIFRALIEHAASFHASDIKLVPEFPPFIRVHGKWHPVSETPVQSFDIDYLLGELSGSEALASKVRNGDFADFAYEIKASRFSRRRFRCNATACVLPGGLSGISLVLRFIPDTVPTAHEVGLVDKDDRPSIILKEMFPQQGIVLITGPTGSGKTTLLAGGIGYLLLAHPHLSVETYEDPVEFDYRTAGGKGPLAQMSVAEHLKGDFTAIAPNAARRSSDVVIVGESRDKTSFRGLLQLADMGLLTLSTLHTRSVAETPTRILNTFSADEQPEVRASLLNGLRFVVQQRLLPTTDGTRVAVREYLAFSERLRFELAYVDTREMASFLRKATEKEGQLLINDVHEKYRQGIISRGTYLRIEQENDEAVKALKGV